MTTKADTILRHAKVCTLDRSRPWAEAVAIKGDRILAVGGDELAALRGERTAVIDAGGRLVLPGFVDCHVHFTSGSLGLDRVDLADARDLGDLRRMLREYAASRPGPGWILGRGWNYAMFGAGARPHRRDLDELFPDRPVLLVSTHLSWVNSPALALARITRDTPDPPHGRIVRDAGGEPTGVIEGGRELLTGVVPEPTRAEKIAALRRGIRLANEHGLTRVHSAGRDFEELALFDELRRQGELTLRLYVAYFLNPPELRAEDLSRLEEAGRSFSGDWLAVGSAKFLLDGIVESRSAALLESYAGASGEKGRLEWEVARYRSAVAELDRRGIQLFTHAIGDRAVRTALDAYEAAARGNRTTGLRHRIEHVETCAAADLGRFGPLGVIASMQPRHAYPDDDTLSTWATALGPDRVSRGFAWKSISTRGGRLAFGSDWPVVTLSPWPGLQTAVTRQTVDRNPAEGFNAGERLTVAEAIEAYTLGAAYAGRRETSEGSLEPGKLADLIMVSQDVFTVDPHEIGRTKVLLTMVGGRIVHQTEAAADCVP